MGKINIKVIPKSKRESVVFELNLLKIHLHSAPEGGKANAELVEILAEKLNIPKTTIKIVRGFSSKNKVVDILGISVDEIRQRLL